MLFLGMIFVITSSVGITASPYNETDKCWEPEREEVASELGVFRGSCDNEVVPTEKDGKYWLFYNGCIPSGFTRIYDAQLIINFCEE